MCAARELGIQLRRDVKPGLDAAGVKLFLVSIGTWERSIQFAEVTDFPRDCLLADPSSSTYEALGLVKGLRQTFLGSQVRAGLLGGVSTAGWQHGTDSKAGKGRAGGAWVRECVL